MQRRTRVTTFGALTAAALTGLAAMPATPATAVTGDGHVFINEIHYDNASTDVGEAIEVAGPAGTDLSGWSIVLYNGGTGTVYDTDALSGVLADQQGGFGTTSVSYPVNGIQNGAPDGIALVDAGGSVVQFLSYEGVMTAVGGPASGMTSTDIGRSQAGNEPAGSSLALTGTGTTYSDFSWSATTDDSFGTVNPGQTFGEGGTDQEPEPEPCDIPITHEIGTVQGTAWSTPMRGQTVTVEGVVVGDFQARGLDGVFIQDPDGDGRTTTSDGIFVYDPDGPDYEVGDVVRVTGEASEYFRLTQVEKVSAIDSCGTADLPAPVILPLPSDDSVREDYESMLVTFDQPLTATETYTLARYGELVVSSGGRLFQPTNDDGDDAAEQALNDRRRLVIDDGSSWQNPDDVPFTDVNGQVIRLGDTLTDVEGVLSYGHSAFRLQPTKDATVARTNPRTASPDNVGGDLQVASFNVLNYFTTIDLPGAVTDAGHDPRGADSQAEFARQQAKIVSAILKLDAEVVGLMEIENDADDEAVNNLVAALNKAAGSRRYAAVQEPNTGGGLFGTDAIKVAMIYKPAAVRPLDRSYTTQDDAFGNARLPLAQRFIPVAGGAPFTAVVNHFKSKSCSEAATGLNADQGDGQGCWNADRVEQAHALLGFIDGLDGEDFMVIGDLNSYGEEDPIDVLEAGGYVDMVNARLAESDQYSYVFSGQAGYLDHALVSPHLARRVTGVDIWHINSDEALFLDYNTEFNPDGFWAPNPYRSSDHDPVLVGLSALPLG